MLVKTINKLSPTNRKTVHNPRHDSKCTYQSKSNINKTPFTDPNDVTIQSGPLPRTHKTVDDIEITDTGPVSSTSYQRLVT